MEPVTFFAFLAAVAVVGSFVAAAWPTLRHARDLASARETAGEANLPEPTVATPSGLSRQDLDESTATVVSAINDGFASLREVPLASTRFFKDASGLIVPVTEDVPVGGVVRTGVFAADPYGRDLPGTRIISPFTSPPDSTEKSRG